MRHLSARRVAAIFGLIAVALATTGEAAALSVKLGTASATREAALCAAQAGCVAGLPDMPPEAPATAHPACLAAALVMPPPVGTCEVKVSVPFSGKGTPGTKVTVTISLQRSDNRVWAHPIERAAEEQAPDVPEAPDELPLPEAVPSDVPRDVPEAPDELPLPEAVPSDVPRDVPDTDDVPADGVEVSDVQPGSWTSSKTLTVKSNGTYASSASFTFQAAGLDDQCETFTVKATAKQGTRVASHTLSSRQICA